MLIVTDKTPRVDIAAILTSDEIAKIEEYMHHYPDPRAAVLDALKIVQKRDGWVNDMKVKAVAAKLGICVADAEGVATFYNRIYRQPVGEHVILLCDSVACYLTGYEAVADAIKNHLNIDYGQTTADGKFTLLPICCLGNCDKAPSMMIDEETFGLVTVDAVADILNGFRNGSNKASSNKASADEQEV